MLQIQEVQIVRSLQKRKKSIGRRKKKKKRPTMINGTHLHPTALLASTCFYLLFFSFLKRTKYAPVEKRKESCSYPSDSLAKRVKQIYIYIHLSLSLPPHASRCGRVSSTGAARGELTEGGGEGAGATRERREQGD